MFGLQCEGTVLKGRGRSQCAEHENEEAQVDQGLTECLAVMLSDPQSTRSAAQAGRWSPIQTFLPPFVKRQTIWTLTATAKSQSVIALEEVHQILMRRGKAGEIDYWLYFRSGFESFQFFREKSHFCLHLMVLVRNLWKIRLIQILCKQN